MYVRLSACMQEKVVSSICALFHSILYNGNSLAGLVHFFLDLKKKKCTFFHFSIVSTFIKVYCKIETLPYAVDESWSSVIPDTLLYSIYLVIFFLKLKKKKKLLFYSYRLFF